MKYHALFVIFENSKIWNCLLLQIIGGALWESMECTKGPFVVESGVVSKYKWQIRNNTCN